MTLQDFLASCQQRNSRYYLGQYEVFVTGVRQDPRELDSMRVIAQVQVIDTENFNSQKVLNKIIEMRYDSGIDVFSQGRMSIQLTCRIEDLSLEPFGTALGNILYV